MLQYTQTNSISWWEVLSVCATLKPLKTLKVVDYIPHSVAFFFLSPTCLVSLLHPSFPLHPAYIFCLCITSFLNSTSIPSILFLCFSYCLSPFIMLYFLQGPHLPYHSVSFHLDSPHLFFLIPFTLFFPQLRLRSMQCPSVLRFDQRHTITTRHGKNNLKARKKIIK